MFLITDRIYQDVVAVCEILLQAMSVVNRFSNYQRTASKASKLCRKYLWYIWEISVIIKSYPQAWQARSTYIITMKNNRQDGKKKEKGGWKHFNDALRKWKLFLGERNAERKREWKNQQINHATNETSNAYRIGYDNKVVRELCGVSHCRRQWNSAHRKLVTVYLKKWSRNTCDR